MEPRTRGLSVPIERVDGFYFHPTSRERVLAQRHADPSKTPWTPLDKPLAECKVTLVSTAGIFMKGRRLFRLRERAPRRHLGRPDPPGDLPGRRARTTWSTRTYTSTLRSWPRTGTCHGLSTSSLDFEREGKIGALAETLYSIMGYIPNFNPLVKRTAPLMIEKMKAEDVDAAFLYPV